jgi:hypothetical protein
MIQQTQICVCCGRERLLCKFLTSGNRGQYRNRVCSACQASRGRAKIRLELLEAFNYKCSCCGEGHPLFLTLEHIHGRPKGTAGRYRQGFPVRQSYQELYDAKRSGWDKTQFELLCMNCNWAKGQVGQCPHRSGVTAEMHLESLRRKATFRAGPSPNMLKALDEHRPKPGVRRILKKKEPLQTEMLQ